jgi:hypothetical protein
MASVRSPTKAEDFSSNLCIQTGSGAHPASYPMGTGGSFPKGKAQLGRDADHSSPSSTEVKILHSQFILPVNVLWVFFGIFDDAEMAFVHVINIDRRRYCTLELPVCFYKTVGLNTFHNLLFDRMLCVSQCCKGEAETFQIRGPKSAL